MTTTQSVVEDSSNTSILENADVSKDQIKSVIEQAVRKAYGEEDSVIVADQDRDTKVVSESVYQACNVFLTRILTVEAWDKYELNLDRSQDDTDKLTDAEIAAEVEVEVRCQVSHYFDMASQEQLDEIGGGITPITHPPTEKSIDAFNDKVDDKIKQAIIEAHGLGDMQTSEVEFDPSSNEFTVNTRVKGTWENDGNITVVGVNGWTMDEDEEYCTQHEWDAMTKEERVDAIATVAEDLVDDYQYHKDVAVDDIRKHHRNQPKGY